MTKLVLEKYSIERPFESTSWFEAILNKKHNYIKNMKWFEKNQVSKTKVII